MEKSIEQRKPIEQHNPIDQRNPIVVSRFARYRLRWKFFTVLFSEAWSQSGSPVKAMGIIRRLRAKIRQVYGFEMVARCAKVDGKYYLRMAAPGFPSKAHRAMMASEVGRVIAPDRITCPSTLFLAITKQCRMNCEHCFEWDEINRQETLDVAGIVEIIKKFAAFGTTQFMLSGGEPMLKYRELLQILKEAPRNADYWIITSGYGLTAERARELKDIGLTGVTVSIDHHIPALHDIFRGYKGAFDIATEAVRNANNAGLVTAVSLCTTREYISPENLDSYMELARSLGVAYAQILEPRKKGRYKDKDVLLKAEHLEVLEEFFMKYSLGKEYRDFPILNYTGYHQRRTGCYGSGSRFFYIDADGDAHLCPFCPGKLISALTHTAEEVIMKLLNTGCTAYETSRG